MTPQPKASPSPSPGPSGGNLTVAQELAALNAAADGKKNTGSAKSLYGMGDWGSQTVNPGDLPVTVNTIAQGQATTGDAVVEAFAHGSPDQIATIQHALMMAGTYYPQSYTPKYGVVSQQDIAAFAEAVKTAGQAGQAVSSLLEGQAKAGATMGITAAQQQNSTKASVATVTLPNTQDLEAEAIKAFQQVLGRKATPKEAAGFAALYRGMAAGLQRAQNQQQYDATNPPVNAALAAADPQALTDQATSVVSHGTQLAPKPLGQSMHDTDFQPTQQTTLVNPADFSTQVGGLMSLGQAVAAAQQTPGSAGGGLTQITQDSLPNAAVAAENYARNVNPKGAAATDTANTFNTFLSLLQRNFG